MNSTKLELTGAFGSIRLELTRSLSESELVKVVSTLSNIVHGDSTGAKVVGCSNVNCGCGKAASLLKINEVSANNANDYYYHIVFKPVPNKINAIKAVREHLGVGLKEAKDIVEGTKVCPDMGSFTCEALMRSLLAVSITTPEHFTVTPVF